MSRRSRFSVLHLLLAGTSTPGVIAGVLFGLPGLVLACVQAEEIKPWALMNEVLQNSLDAAEQRNAEDSPSGIARHSSLGLTG
ncbi:hypothetical protein [Pseudomonas sp. LFM046]|uniref:hypothetical protein n=1 Tax=Pseudomonas sp. LFM046 TaxID=1608357 RepID=UPI0005CFA1A1|nr:hypothetical protein [Pseudomonas sp. LFM046]